MITAQAVTGLPEVREGDDVAALIHAAGGKLMDGDIVVIASKIVAKAQGRYVPATERETALARETVRQVAARWLPEQDRATRVVQTRSGPVLVAAGIDASDVPPAPDGTDRVLLLPEQPDAAARQIRAGLQNLTGARLGVLITDTSGRPWRLGVSDFALGAAGFTVLDDRRGTLDRDGRQLDVTVRAIADELAAMADLVKGKAAGTPVAIIRGLGHLVLTDLATDEPGAESLVRTGPTDWFRFGADEAVRHALGLRQGPDTEDLRPANLNPPGDQPAKAALTTAVHVATAGPRWPADITVTHAQDRITVQGNDFDRGIATERLLVALTTVALTARVTHPAAGLTELKITELQ